jgi:hypothetical protein
VVAATTANADLDKIDAIVGAHDALGGGGGSGAEKEATR